MQQLAWWILGVSGLAWWTVVALTAGCSVGLSKAGSTQTDEYRSAAKTMFKVGFAMIVIGVSLILLASPGPGSAGDSGSPAPSERQATPVETQGLAP